MMNEYKKYIMNVKELLHSATFSRDYSMSALRILFLKYAIDNYIGAFTTEDMQAYGKVQKMFSWRDNTNNIGAIIPVLRNLDFTYRLNQVFSASATIEAYEQDLFGFDTARKKKNASDIEFQRLRSFVGSLNLEEDESHSVGSVLADVFLSEITASSTRSSVNAGNPTPRSISMLAKALLCVRDNDTFVDFTSGLGCSSLMICGDARPKIMNAELDCVSAASSAMLYILAGHKNFHIEWTDSLSAPIEDFCGNKLFIDPPFSAKLPRSDFSKYTDSSLAALSHIMDSYLTTPGEAVMVCLGSLLFQSKPQTVALRERLVEGGMLKAVITLPAMSSFSTGITVHLLVISKSDINSHNDILFIDLAREMKANRYRNALRDSVIPEDLIEKITACMDSPEAIPGFSCVVPCDTIRNNQYNLVPASYLPAEEEEDTITIDEINEQLEELYKLLRE